MKPQRMPKKQPPIRLLTLSTCFFCTRAKKWFDEAGFDYTCDDLDLLPAAERQELLDEIRPFNPEERFPIIIINNKAMIGFQEKRIKQELGIP